MTHIGMAAQATMLLHRTFHGRRMRENVAMAADAGFYRYFFVPISDSNIFRESPGAECPGMGHSILCLGHIFGQVAWRGMTAIAGGKGAM